MAIILLLPSFQRTLYSRKKLENKTFPKASRWNCEDIYPTLSLLFAFSHYILKVTQRCVCCEFEFCVTGRRVCHYRHIAFLSVIEDAPLLTKTVKINQSEGIPGSGILESTFVKNSYKRSRTSLPSPPLLFIAFFTSHRSPLSERLEQAIQSDVESVSWASKGNCILILISVKFYVYCTIVTSTCLHTHWVPALKP